MTQEEDGLQEGHPNDAGFVGITDDQRLGHYVEMWKQAVQVQMQFNDLELRIRALALTVATFSLGAAGLAAKDGIEVGGVSLGAIVVLVGLILWYSFYFMDRAWYHPMLQAAVLSGLAMEKEIQKSLGEAGLTRTITSSKPYRAPWLVRKLSRTDSRAKREHDPFGVDSPVGMHSTDKLIWFYTVGGIALGIVAGALQIAALLS